MSRRLAEVHAARAEMFPDIGALKAQRRKPTKNEQRVFDRYRLSKKARSVAVYASRNSADAQAIYAAIVRSLTLK